MLGKHYSYKYFFIAYFALNYNIMKYILLFIFIFPGYFAYSQLFVDTNEKYKFEFGIEPGGVRIMKKNRITFEKNYFAIVEIKPYMGYYPFKKANLSFGLKGQYHFVKSNLISLPSVYGAGVYTKYILSKTPKYNFFKHIRFFSQIDYNRLNFTINDSIPSYEFEDFSFTFADKSSILEYNNFNVTAGFLINMGKNINLEIYGKYTNFIEGQTFIKPAFSISYIFKEKTPNQIIEEKNKKLIPKTEKTPNQNLMNGFIAGSSLTYIYDSNTKDYPVGENFYEEYTWNVNFATTLNKRFTAGIQLLTIFTSGTHVKKSNYFIYGLFTQFDFLPKSKSSLFLETSINRGDYGTCGHLDPYRIKNLWYYGLGGGFEFPIKKISKNLFIDISIYNYLIINNIKTKYNYTQYIIGLNYHFGKKRK